MIGFSSPPFKNGLVVAFVTACALMPSTFAQAQQIPIAPQVRQQPEPRPSEEPDVQRLEVRPDSQRPENRAPQERPATETPSTRVDPDDETEGGRCRVVSRRNWFGHVVTHRKCD